MAERDSIPASRVIRHKKETVQRRRILLAGGSILLVSLSGCQRVLDNRPPVDEVEINFEGMRAPSLGLTNATMKFILEFVNPTNQQIPRPGFDYELFINDVKAVTSREVIPMIPAGESVRETLEAIVEYADLSGGVVQALKEGQFKVRLEGVLRSEGATKETTLQTSYPESQQLREEQKISDVVQGL